MIFIIIGLTVVVITALGILYIRNRSNEECYDPFGFCPHCNIMKTELSCPECNMKCTRPWAKGDFVGKITDEKCTTVCKDPECQGQLAITGIWVEKRKTKEDLEYAKLVAKWK